LEDCSSPEFSSRNVQVLKLEPTDQIRTGIKRFMEIVRLSWLSES
jgi:hypothetical protein